MIFSQSYIPDVFVIEPQKLEDERGFFARGFCSNEFKEHGLEENFVQCNLSFNNKLATTRGMHFQRSPHEEVKVVRCVRGAIFDVVVDFRKDSPTYLQWFGVELSSDNRRMLYVPRGFAHGYQTLTDESEVFYHVSEFYTPGSEGGLRWNDPKIGIKWPHPNPKSICISDKDANWNLLD